jgi:hypothetical protein
MVSTAALATPLPKAEQPPSLDELWQEILANLRLRLPRGVYRACVRQAKLVDVAGNLVTIGVADALLKDTLGHQYASSLSLALSDALGNDVTVRVVMRMST